MKIRWMRLSAWLLGILGITSCNSKIIDDDEMMCMYGTPIMNYKMHISVKDEAGNPIEGIEVLDVRHLGWEPKDKTSTDKDGKAEITGEEASLVTNLIFNDIDGEANGGEFASDSIVVHGDVWEQIAKGDGLWDCGTYETTVEEVLVKKQ